MVGGRVIKINYTVILDISPVPNQMIIVARLV